MLAVIVPDRRMAIETQWNSVIQVATLAIEVRNFDSDPNSPSAKTAMSTAPQQDFHLV
jgi:hypothetical protein